MPANTEFSPAIAMLMKVVERALARPRRAISSAIPGCHAWSETSTKSAPSNWWASRTSARPTRSAKKATLVMLATATTSAIASTRSSPARQSRNSILSDCFILLRSARPPGGRSARSAAPGVRRA